MQTFQIKQTDWEDLHSTIVDFFKLVCLVGNPNEHFDKSYDTERCPEVDHVEYSNRQSLINIMDAVQSLQSLMVKYHLTICRICLVKNTMRRFLSEEHEQESTLLQNVNVTIWSSGGATNPT